MSDIVGKIKITEEQIITTKRGLIQTWTRWGNGDENNFIVYNNIRYKLVKTKEVDIVEDEVEDL
jgi:hypothetical protein